MTDDSSPQPDSPQSDAEGRFRCDFCGAEVPLVRRVALDRDYDRLQKPHQVQYACPECSERKDRERSPEAPAEGSRAGRAGSA